MKNIATSLIATSLVTGVLGLSAPAMACEMHGAGYSNGAFGMKWQSYNPMASTTDPALDDALTDEMTGEPRYTPLPKTAPAKPSFSSAATRASQRALMQRTKAASEEAENTSEPDTPAVQKVSLDSDR